jgi:DNA-binding transcriptional ArsR family regulator
MSVNMSRPATADVFRAIADPTRRGLLDQLMAGEQPMSRLAAAFAMTLPAVSQHLKVLREVGLVSEQRAGRQRLYRINAGPLREVADWVGHYEEFWAGKLDALEQHLRENP